MFLKNTSPGGTFAVGFIPQNFTGHNMFMNNTGPGLRVICMGGWVMDCLGGNNFLDMMHVGT